MGWCMPPLGPLPSQVYYSAQICLDRYACRLFQALEAAQFPLVRVWIQSGLSQGEAESCTRATSTSLITSESEEHLFSSCSWLSSLRWNMLPLLSTSATIHLAACCVTYDYPACSVQCLDLFDAPHLLVRKQQQPPIRACVACRGCRAKGHCARAGCNSPNQSPLEAV